MSWPAQSPDINIIENLWLFVKRKLQLRTGNIKSKFSGFGSALHPSMYTSISRQNFNVIRLKGHLTKY